MSSPAPLLRPPVPGSRSSSASGPRKPALGLAIPPSPHVRPVVNGSSDNVPTLAKPMPPALRLATPMGSNASPGQNQGRPTPPKLAPIQIAPSTSGSSDASAQSRSDSFGEPQLDAIASSTTSMSALNFINPISAVSSSAGGASPGGAAMERESSVGLLPDLNKLRIDLGRDLDVEDLDDAGWKAASKDGRILELGSLGEGAGGAVTRCVLKDGKSVFALKVGLHTS